jgi:hypothetical protein
MKQEDKTPEALGLPATGSGTSDPPPGDERVIEAMHEYLAALEAGKNPTDPRSWRAIRPLPKN